MRSLMRVISLRVNLGLFFGFAITTSSCVELIEARSGRAACRMETRPDAIAVHHGAPHEENNQSLPGHRRKQRDTGMRQTPESLRQA